MAKRQCAFCGEPATTGEHIWSDWVNPLLGKRRQYVISDQIADREWSSVGLHLKLPVLCGACNNEWGSDIESLMKNVSFGMIRGERTTLNRQHLCAVSVYSQLKAFISDYGQEGMKSFYGLAERRAFRNALTFPPGTNIWLARTFDDRGIFIGTYGRPPHNIPKRLETHIFTMSLGQLLIQLTTTRWTKKSSRRYSDPPFLIQPAVWNDFSIPIYPEFPIPAHWPPPERVGDDLINEFLDRWKTLNRMD